jgi:hypothetical protein
VSRELRRSTPAERLREVILIAAAVAVGLPIYFYLMALIYVGVHQLMGVPLEDSVLFRVLDWVSWD